MHSKVRRVQVTLEVIGGKWKPILLWQFLSGPKRYSQLRRELSQVSEKVLIQHLRELERDNIIERVVLSRKPLEVEYRTTAHGESLQPLFQVLSHWGRDHLRFLETLSNADVQPADGDSDATNA